MVRVPRLAPVAILVLLCSALLSGCSSAPDAAPSASAPPTLYTVTASSAPVAKLTTDTFHLLARPDLTPRPPTGTEPIRVPIDSFWGQTVNGAAVKSFQDTWNTTLTEDVNGFVGNATMFVEVTGSLVADPRTIVQGPGCFWNLAVVDGSPETGTYHDLGCVKAAGTIPAGIYRLDFPFALPEVSLPSGTDLHFELLTYEQVQRSPGSAADLLTASVPYDSVIRVYGLHLPLGPPSLLPMAT